MSSSRSSTSSPPEYIIFISGSREWNRPDVIHDALASVVIPQGLFPVLIHGDCKSGADQMAKQSSIKLGWKNRPYTITSEMWRTQGKSAGPRRNATMIQTEKPHVILTFCKNNSPGTSNANQLSAAYCSQLTTRCVMFKKYQDNDGDGNDISIKIVKKQ
jgi:hypothetical protein